MFAAHGATHVGLVRKSNEDSFHADAAAGVFIVADGMGGHNAGEVASRLAVDTVCEFLDRTKEDHDITWPFGLDPALPLDANRLVTAIKLANLRILQASAHEQRRGMGTTVVAALVNGDQAVFASAGDSRLYAFADGHLQQLTKDDSWAAEVLARDPSMTPEAIARNPGRHLLTNVVGAREAVTVACGIRQLTKGQLLLLCSDGLHGPVPDAVIEATMASASDVAVIAGRLVQEALDRGARDNVTAVVIGFASN
ncbi:MAG: protein phosphatase 2C domain-containing protein [Vicinamibacterales bacterium]